MYAQFNPNFAVSKREFRHFCLSFHLCSYQNDAIGMAEHGLGASTAVRWFTAWAIFSPDDDMWGIPSSRDFWIVDVPVNICSKKRIPTNGIAIKWRRGPLYWNKHHTMLAGQVHLCAVFSILACTGVLFLAIQHLQACCHYHVQCAVITMYRCAVITMYRCAGNSLPGVPLLTHVLLFGYHVCAFIQVITMCCY